MGRATIVGHLGDGLYSVRLKYSSALDKLLSDTIKARDGFAATYLAAIKSRDEYQRAAACAREALDEVVRNWVDAILTATTPPPEIEPAEPGGDALDEQGAALFSAVNAARGSALTRVEALDSAAAGICRMLCAKRRTSDSEFTADQRAVQYGYGVDPEIGAARVIALGAPTAERAVQNMLRHDSASLTNVDFTDCGCAFFYDSSTPWAYTWCVMLAAPGTTHEIEWPPKDPAKENAENQGGELNKIKAPETDALTPASLAEMCGEFGRAAAMAKAAQAEVDRITLENGERESLISRLQSLKNASNQILTAWCCQYVTSLAPGTIVGTAEVPGYLALTAPSAPQANLNLVPSASGELRHSIALKDGPCFVDMALEPGHLKWKPAWRYGVITAMLPDGRCNLTIESATGRRLASAGERAGADLNSSSTLSNVQISYPCSGVFFAGDEVLIQFTGQDRTKPVVIGFRSHPKACGGKISWEQIQ